ncbi:MAG TPA: hypothetical protein VHC44_06825 [Verrucomicrobiae bacterium]|nr:hypothetical protein [Verrucomicrobiae bacterium]
MSGTQNNGAQKKNPFYETLTDCLEGKHECLRGKNIPLQIRAEEIVLIQEALEVYLPSIITETLNEVASDFASRDKNAEGRKRVISEVESAYAKMEERLPVIKKLLFKLSEAMEIAAQREEGQTGLNLGGSK